MRWYIKANQRHIYFVIWWRHEMETFSAYWQFMWGIHRSRMNTPHKGQWFGALMFYLICAWTNSRVNNWYASNSRLHPAHHDVTNIYKYPTVHSVVDISTRRKCLRNGNKPVITTAVVFTISYVSPWHFTGIGFQKWHYWAKPVPNASRLP